MKHMDLLQIFLLFIYFTTYSWITERDIAGLLDAIGHGFQDTVGYSAIC
jgi:hypothetical protein